MTVLAARSKNVANHEACFRMILNLNPRVVPQAIDALEGLDNLSGFRLVRDTDGLTVVSSQQFSMDDAVNIRKSGENQSSTSGRFTS